MTSIFSQYIRTNHTSISTYFRIRNFLFLCIALTYGYVVSQIPNTSFYDFSAYLEYAQYSQVRMEFYLTNNLISLLSNEPIWLLINSGLSLLFEPEITVRLIIFLSASITSWLLLYHYPKHFVWLALFFLFPQVIKNYLLHIRQGLGICLFTCGWFSVNRSLRWLFFILTPLVHSSFFIILFMFFANFKDFGRKRISPEIKFIVYILVSISLVFSIGYAAQLLGARQVNDYSFQQTNVSGFGFTFWTVIAAIMATAKRSWFRQYSFEFSIVILYLSSYWFLSFTARIFESGLLFVLLSGLALNGWQKKVFLSLFLIFSALVWISKLGQPILGFGS